MVAADAIGVIDVGPLDDTAKEAVGVAVGSHSEERALRHLMRLEGDVDGGAGDDAAELASGGGTLAEREEGDGAVAIAQCGHTVVVVVEMLGHTMVEHGKPGTAGGTVAGEAAGEMVEVVGVAVVAGQQVEVAQVEVEAYGVGVGAVVVLQLTQQKKAGVDMGAIVDSRIDEEVVEGGCGKDRQRGTGAVGNGWFVGAVDGFEETLETTDVLAS